jgi:branched-chain amino acid transport system substrate-binding protein
MRSNRWRLRIVFLALAALLGATPAAFAKDPIKIGFMAPYVGVFAKSGRDMDNGFRLALEEAGYKAAGRQIIMLSEDDEAKPELGPTKARKLIENEKVQILAGIIHSGVALSVRDIAVNHKVPLIITNAGATELTAKLKSPYIFRVSFSNGQQDLAGGWYAYNKLGLKRMIVLAPDFVAGHEKADGFMKTFKAAGGQVVEELYPPTATNDFGPFLTKIQAKANSADGLWVFFIGSGAIRLVNQYEEYGLKTKVPMFVIGDTVDDTLLPSMKEAAVGIKNYLHYADTIKNPENEKFVKAYRAKYNEYPGVYSEQGYLGAKAILMALEAVKGDVENREAFLAAMRKVKFHAPQGPFSFDANQNAIIPVYIREVRKVDGRYANVDLDVIPAVDQDWSPAKMKR